MNEERLDLSALDPTRDAEGWEHRVQNILSRAAAAQAARRWTIEGQLRIWARPAFALAAAAALLCWLGVMVGSGSSAEKAEAESAASALSRWAAGDETPSVERMLSVLEGSH